MLCYALAIVINYVLFCAFHVFIESRYLCQALAIGPTAVVTYSLLKNFVFTDARAGPVIDESIVM